jgi:hypothetical protein
MVGEQAAAIAAGRIFVPDERIVGARVRAMDVAAFIVPQLSYSPISASPS